MKKYQNNIYNKVGYNMNKKRGFTLVEIIVAIAIMGLIMMLAFHMILNLQESNKNKRYET